MTNHTFFTLCKYSVGIGAGLLFFLVTQNKTNLLVREFVLSFISQFAIVMFFLTKALPERAAAVGTSRYDTTRRVSQCMYAKNNYTMPCCHCQSSVDYGNTQPSMH